jgi:hypothetical protein
VVGWAGKEIYKKFIKIFIKIFINIVLQSFTKSLPRHPIALAVFTVKNTVSSSGKACKDIITPH